MKMPSQTTRAYIYRCLTAGAPIVATYAAISSTEIVLWLALAATVLGTGLAAANTPADNAPKDEAGVSDLGVIVAICLAVILFCALTGRI